VTLAADGDALLLARDDGAIDRVPAHELRFVERRAAETVYGRAGRAGWRLIVADAALDVAALLPDEVRYGRWIDRVGLWKAAAAGIVASAAILLTIRELPHWIAPLIPDSWMDSYGEALVGDFGGKFCAGPGGQAAIDKLVRRIAPEARVKVRVVDIGIVNAAALPGGNIVIFEELLQKAESPEEFAGVLAHEIAHVQNRDVTEAMVRELGFGLVFGMIGGDAGGQVQKLAALSYSRDAERRADAGAIAALRKAGISPAPTAKFFDRLAKAETKLPLGAGLAYLSTHPVSAERAAEFRNAALPGKQAPILTRDEWDALADICRTRKPGA
jgi:Zn-dependent protease with chaperone function